MRKLRPKSLAKLPKLPPRPFCCFSIPSSRAYDAHWLRVHIQTLCWFEADVVFLGVSCGGCCCLCVAVFCAWFEDPILCISNEQDSPCNLGCLLLAVLVVSVVLVSFFLGLAYHHRPSCCCVRTLSQRALAALVVMTFPELAVVYEDYQEVALEEPYVSGYLAFREVRPLAHLLRRLRAASPQLFPQVVFVDGSGVMHPNGLGHASHLGVVADVPTIGVTKKLLSVDGLHRAGVLESVRCPSAGPVAWLKGDSGRTWGAALQGPEGSRHKPIFVSVGHRLSLETAVALVQACSKFRIPEPIRQADLRSRALIRSSTSYNAIDDTDACPRTSQGCTFAMRPCQ
mmetsp:Transcript_3605/g.7041  ORF Transcript_3605/g.7041 Transcript_3605/m.7041 type:complete len:342 (+) Transcript_3605:1144-2169(+)